MWPESFSMWFCSFGVTRGWMKILRPGLRYFVSTWHVSLQKMSPGRGYATQGLFQPCRR
jgi:hypothetical protein